MDGARLREGLIDPQNTASDLWADSAYRSARNEEFLTESGLISRECPFFCEFLIWSMLHLKGSMHDDLQGNTG